MARIRHNGVITGSVPVKTALHDAIGGGTCKIHGDYYGHGKYMIKDCPFCDIDAHWEKVKKERNDER